MNKSQEGAASCRAAGRRAPKREHFLQGHGCIVPTELVDLKEISDDRIRTYNEFCVPR
jgi:hypothetical protein